MSKEYIYELSYLFEGKWYPFYVGRTNDTTRRHREHNNTSFTGTTDVYCFIRDLRTARISWRTSKVLEYEKEDYVQQEDDHILKLLFDGIDLMNMKKGDAKWKARTLANMEKAKLAGCKSVKEYVEWDRVERKRIRDNKAAKRIEEENVVTLVDRIKRQPEFIKAQKEKEAKQAEAVKKSAAILDMFKR